MFVEVHVVGVVVVVDVVVVLVVGLLLALAVVVGGVLLAQRGLEHLRNLSKCEVGADLGHDQLALLGGQTSLAHQHPALHLVRELDVEFTNAPSELHEPVHVVEHGLLRLALALVEVGFKGVGELGLGVELEADVQEGQQLVESGSALQVVRVVRECLHRLPRRARQRAEKQHSREVLLALQAHARAKEERALAVLAVPCLAVVEGGHLVVGHRRRHRWHPRGCRSCRWRRWQRLVRSFSSNLSATNVETRGRHPPSTKHRRR